jgi:UDP-N-acetylglucosamine diphosphorylase / glucose-1-phosphate thymidylyltransferase / UDP-N-acetylgalactosamine diphosphorylase / glucosamine-1-phosphate N-acetyltransferase / galactosamine-1-phosphate N-acetyltransferase
MTTRAIVLARGLGTRMREPDPAAALNEAQQRAADAGSKMMIPVHGRPFLDYALSALAEAGIDDVALVVAPDHGAIAAHYRTHPTVRVRLAFVVQPEPLGTANAVLAAAAWAGGDPFLAMNADNLYPVAALEALASLDEPGLPAFDRDDLVRSSNIPAERIFAFALVDVDDQGYLTGIVEKPKDQSRRKDACISMNCWRFDSRIFGACRDVPKSARGEHELPEAVGLAAHRGVRFRAIAARGPVLDLSRRADAADVERRLAGTAPRP